LTTIPKYNTLTEAIEAHVKMPRPDQAATKILRHFEKRFPDATHAVLFVNLDFSSSQFGHWTVMVVGPGQTYKKIEDVDGSWLHDLPSMRQYPSAYVELKGVPHVE
jgi:predicted YcjX-like family ATPase